jgi:hypothetical protein
MDYRVEIQGLTDFSVFFRAIKEYRDEIQEAMREAAEAAGSYMQLHAPYASGDIYRAIFVGPLTYRPGAAGGGGYYEINVGVDEGQAPHTEHVIEGTGIYNREQPNAGIFPSKGNVMVFQAGGEKVFTAWTKGQEPQREWFENAMELADRLIEQAIRG